MKSLSYLFFFSLINLGLFSCGTNTTDGTTTKDGNVKVISNRDSDPINDGRTNLKPNKGGPDDEKIQRVGFYNVENLFDTADDAKKRDEDFTPSGKNVWTKDKYKEKLNHLARVIDYMGQPGLMGLAEVENQSAIKDLIKESAINDAKYAIVHQESPDFRGIDVALLYSTDEYKLVSRNFIQIDFPENIVTNYTTRDLLHATLQNNKKEYIHVFVCHWPSRRGGVKESEPKRVYVAQQLRKEIDKIFNEFDNNHVIVMGDLNDEPSNKSVNQILSAKPEVSDPKSESLYDLVYEFDREGLGTHNYRGEWNMLDHIIVSGSLLDGKGTDVKNTQIFNRDWMLFFHKKSNQYRPNRTFSGGKYYGGYSDHLPVSVEIVD